MLKCLQGEHHLDSVVFLYIITGAGSQRQQSGLKEESTIGNYKKEVNIQIKETYLLIRGMGQT